VASTAMLALAGATTTDLSVTAEGTAPHPVFAITSDTTKKETGM
jgi:hypothetical protein